MAASMLSSCAVTPPTPVTAAPAGNLSLGTHEAQLNGARVWYRVAGNWDGRSAPVVYLAGGPGGNSHTFSRIAGPHLEPGNLIVYYDQRGTGRSERPASGDYAILTLVEDIEALRRHLGVAKMALVAHSFGGILALEYAARHPDNIAALVLAGTLWNAPLQCREQAQRIAEWHPEVYGKMMAAGEPTDEEVCDRVFRAFRGEERERFNERLMFPDPATLDVLTRTDAESVLRNTGELSSAVFRQGLLQYRFQEPGRIVAPVLVVTGTRDLAAAPPTQKVLATLLPRGRLLEYDGLGHWVFLDDPARFGRDVSAFLDAAAR
jgi:proline iminopeptidase